MLIWRGKGWSVPATVFMTSLVTEFSTEAWFKDGAYYQDHRWPITLAMVTSASALLILSDRGDSTPVRDLVDLNTGKRVVIKNEDSFFFIPLRYWPYLLCATGVGVLSLGPQPYY